MFGLVDSNGLQHQFLDLVGQITVPTSWPMSSWWIPKCILWNSRNQECTIERRGPNLIGFSDIQKSLKRLISFRTLSGPGHPPPWTTRSRSHLHNWNTPFQCPRSRAAALELGGCTELSPGPNVSLTVHWAGDPVNSHPRATLLGRHHPRSSRSSMKPWMCHRTREPTVLSKTSLPPRLLNFDHIHQPFLLPWRTPLLPPIKASSWLSSPYHVATTHPCGKPRSFSSELVRLTGDNEARRLDGTTARRSLTLPPLCVYHSQSKSDSTHANSGPSRVAACYARALGDPISLAQRWSVGSFWCWSFHFAFASECSCIFPKHKNLSLNRHVLLLSPTWLLCRLAM